MSGAACAVRATSLVVAALLACSVAAARAQDPPREVIVRSALLEGRPDDAAPPPAPPDPWSLAFLLHVGAMATVDGTSALGNLGPRLRAGVAIGFLEAGVDLHFGVPANVALPGVTLELFRVDPLAFVGASAAVLPFLRIGAELGLGASLVGLRTVESPGLEPAPSSVSSAFLTVLEGHFALVPVRFLEIELDVGVAIPSSTLALSIEHPGGTIERLATLSPIQQRFGLGLTFHVD